MSKGIAYIQTHSSLPPLCSRVQFLLHSQDQSPSSAQELPSSELKWSGGSLNFQFQGILVVSPVGTKTSRPAVYKVVGGQEGNILPAGPRSNSVWCHFHFHLLVPGNLWEKQHHRLDADSEHIQPPREPCLSPARCLHIAGSVSESARGHSTVVPNPQLQDGKEHGKTCEFPGHGWTHCITSFTVK